MPPQCWQTKFSRTPTCVPLEHMCSNDYAVNLPCTHARSMQARCMQQPQRAAMQWPRWALHQWQRLQHSQRLVVQAPGLEQSPVS